MKELIKKKCHVAKASLGIWMLASQLQSLLSPGEHALSQLGSHLPSYLEGGHLCCFVYLL